MREEEGCLNEKEIDDSFIFDEFLVEGFVSDDENDKEMSKR